MLGLNDAAMTVLASVAMIAAFVVALLPIVPGHIIMWGIAVVYAWATGFHYVGLLGLGIMTVLALLATTSDFWLPMVGVKTRGGSCSSVIGTIIGGILGTLLIPVPVLGTLIGSMLGAASLEYLQWRSMDKAGRAARFALSNFMASYVIGLGASITILIVFFVSLLIN